MMAQAEALPHQRSAASTARRALAAGRRSISLTEFDLEDFFHNGGIALHLVGPDGTILHANKAELELLGYPADEYIGRHIAEFHADQDVFEDMLVRLSGGEKLQKYPVRLRARDGSPSRRPSTPRTLRGGWDARSFLPFPTPIRDEEGQLIGAVNMLVDVTERKIEKPYSAEALIAEVNAALQAKRS